MKWSKTKHPGIRCREHETRKHGSIQKDRYFAIRYQLDGKRREEGLGWTSEGWTVEKAVQELSDIKMAHTTGQGAASLAEKRELEKARREKEKAEQARFEKDSLTFGQFFDETYLPIAKTSKKKRSHGTEEQLFRLWLSPQIGNTPVKGITAFHVERIKKTMLTAGKSARTIQYAFATVRQVWNMARRNGIVDVDCPTKAVKLPKIDNRRLRFLSPSEAKILLDALKTRSVQLHNMALLSLQTGMRAGEIFNLQWGHIDFERGFINIVDTKAGRNRAAYMTGEVKVMLNGLYGDGKKQGSFIFTTKDGEQIKEISTSFDREVKDLGWNINITDPRQKVVFHSLRHTFASWLVENGTDLYTVKELMGHSTLAMTERYSHLGANTLQSAIKSLEKKMKKQTIKPTDKVKGKSAGA